MNVHHLELFYYVAKHRGITQAVRQMPYGIQQPAVSGQILQLEKDLEVKLFQRRPFALTPAGEELYEFLVPFFSRLDEVAARLRGEAASHLRLASSPTILTMHLPGVLEAVRKKVPDLKLTLRQVMPAEIDGVLANQEADIAISVLRGKATPPVKSVELVRLPVVLLVPEGAKHRSFAAIKKAAKSREIGLPFITLPSQEALTQQFQDELGHEGLHWTPTMEVSTLDLVHSYVSHGFGYGLTVEVPLPRAPENVTVIRLPKFPPLIIGFSHTGDLSPVASLFLEEARRYGKQLGGKKR